MGYRWLLTLILAVHFAYLGYLVLGGFLAWRWPKAIWPHLASAVWGVLIVANWVNCPLTWAENQVRQLDGQPPLTRGFIDRYIDNVIYPERYVNLVRLGVALVIAVSWAGAFLLWRRRRDLDTDPKSGGQGDRAITV